MEDQIRGLIRRYLANQIDRAAFSQAFASFYFRVRNNRESSSESKQLRSRIVLPFAELSRGDRTEDSFRADLRAATGHFVTLEFQVGEIAVRNLTARRGVIIW